VVAGLLAAPWALSQSSVSIYGSVDAGVDYLSNVGGGSMTAVNSGKRSPDRLGFRGTEDLGGGTFATFRLESGFNLDSGTSIQPTIFFNRHASVGIGNRSYGSLLFGRFFDYAYDYLSPLGNAIPGLSSSFNVGALDFPGAFLENAVRYDSPKWGGFEFGLANGFGEVPGQFQKNRRASAGVRYDRDGLVLAATYSRFNDRAVDVRGLFGFTSFLGQPLAPGAQFAASQVTTTGVGASYKIGAFTPHALLTDIKLENANGAEKLHNYQAGVNIELPYWGTRNILGLSAARYTIRNIAQNQYNLFFTHHLSTRVQVYTGLSRANAQGPGATAGVSGYGKSSTDSQNFFRVGVHTLF
jgi:predicted porin